MGPPCRASRRSDAQGDGDGEARARRADGLEKRAPSELSGGQQQRVAVARALVLEPQVLLFDEPLSNLDAKLRRRVREDIRELQQSLNLTVAYVTHDQEEALAVSDHIIVMSNARIAQTGTPRELYEEPADLFVADFIGDANILTGVLGEPEGNLARVQIGALSVRLPHRGVRRRFGETGGAAGCDRVEREPQPRPLPSAERSPRRPIWEPRWNTRSKARWAICSSCNMAAVTPSRPARPWRFP